MWKDIGLYIILTIQLILWTFIVLMAPVHSRGMAIFNLKYLIPFMFVLQVLPFDIFGYIKSLFLKPEEITSGTDNYKRTLFLPVWFDKAKDFIGKYTDMNPLGPQALLIIAAIISGYKE